MIALLVVLTGCTYNDEFSCEPWQGWWSGELSGDLNATLVGEFYAYYEGAFTPSGGGTLTLGLRDVDLAPLLGQEGPTAPGAAYGVAAPGGGDVGRAASAATPSGATPPAAAPSAAAPSAAEAVAASAAAATAVTAVFGAGALGLTFAPGPDSHPLTGEPLGAVISGVQVGVGVRCSAVRVPLT